MHLNRFTYVPIFAVLIFTLSAIAIPDAHAVGGIVSDGPSCVAIGGTWNGFNGCTVTSLTVNSGEILTITGGISFAVSGTITNSGIINIGPVTFFNNVGTITNFGTITNDGDFENGSTITNFGTITNLVNFGNGGTINNRSGGTIDNGGTFSSSNTINNFSTITNSGTMTNINLSASGEVGGTINNNSGGTINNLGSFAIGYVGTISNSFGSTINNNIGGIINNAGHILNFGTINNNIYSKHGCGDSLINNAGGVIENGQTLTNFKGGCIVIGSGSTLINTASLSNNGTIGINSGSAFINNVGGTMSNLFLGSIINSGATVNFGSINNQNIITNNCGAGSLNFGSFTGNDLVTFNCITAIHPTTGPVGTLVTVNGTSYPPSSTIAIQYNAVGVASTPATIITTTAGAFLATFVVPPSTGPNTVTATDSSGANVGKATFTVTTTSFPIIQMSDTTASFDSLISSSRPFIGEYASPTSTLIGKPIDSITLRMAKVGAPTGTAQVGIFDVNRNVVKLFATVDVSTISTTDTVYEFKLPATDLYTIASGDRIGIKYTGGTASVGINVTPDRVAGDPFDGANSYRVRYETAWITSSSEDMYMILKQTHG